MSKKQLDNIAKFVQVIALKTCIIYLIFGALWILFSDAVILYFFDDPVVITQIQTYKGLFYVGLTSVLLYGFIRSQITQKALVSNKLMKIEKRYKWLVNNTSDIIIILGKNGIINFISGSYSKTTGFGEDELLGKNIFEAIHGDDSSVFRKKFILDYSPHKENPVVEYRFMHKNGHWLYFESVATSFIDDNLVSGVLISTRDITKRKEMQNQLMRTQRLESVGAIAGGISHDLNNIFSPLMLSVDMLKREELSSRGKRVLETVEKAVLHGKKMVEQILAFSKGKGSTKQVASLNDIVKDVETLISSTLSKGVSVVVDVEENLPDINADITQIHQVIINLCVNAKDALKNGGLIKIKGFITQVSKNKSKDLRIIEGDYVVLRVSDNGEGINEDIKENIFTPFFTTKSEGKGTGLGLPTVKRIIEDHQGAIQLESKKGEGTSFSVYLPVYEKDYTEDEKPKATLTGDLILIAENDFSFVSMLNEYFKSFGFKVVHAADGYAAASLFTTYSKTIKVLIVDAEISNMEFSQFIGYIKKQSQDTPVIATLYKENPFQGEIEKIADAVAIKPYSGDDIKKIIDDILIVKK